MIGKLEKLGQPADLLRSVAIALIALLTAYAVTRTDFFQNLDLQLHDVQARVLAQEVDFSDIIFVDVSEESIKSLEPEIGAWPYSRSVYAKVTEFLRNAGARSMTFDIVFAERRPQDERSGRDVASKRRRQRSLSWRRTIPSLPPPTQKPCSSILLGANRPPRRRFNGNNLFCRAKCSSGTISRLRTSASSPSCPIKMAFCDGCRCCIKLATKY